MDATIDLVKDNSALLDHEQIHYKNLDETFYQGMRNELTKERLKQNTEIAIKIEEPEPYGSYNSEEHFLLTFDLFLKCTDETRHRGWFLLKHVLPQINKGGALLDVGPGSGLLTKWIGSNFSSVTVIDTNYQAIKNFNIVKKILKNRTHLNKIHDSILSIPLKSNHYDLGLLSHVFYYIDASKWLEATLRVYESVKTGGKVLIVLNGDQFDKLDLIKYFQGKTIDINTFAKNCLATFGHTNVKLFESIETTKTADLQSMLHTIGFFLYDVGVTAKKEDLINYIRLYLSNSDTSFSMRFSQKFILIQKN